VVKLGVNETQVDIFFFGPATGTAEKVRLSGLPDEHTLSGRPDSEWLA
jgi:hypothetical protein